MSGTEKRARKGSLTFRLLPEERAVIDAAASAVGLTAGSYAREVLLGAPAPRPVRSPPAERRELARLLGELGKIGSNLNQLAKASHTGAAVYQSEIMVTLGGLHVLRDAILAALGRAP
jgi:hypothetical protein